MNTLPPPAAEIASGMPNWVDLGTHDLADATRFYTSLFGWTAHVRAQSEAGGYTIFNKDDRVVAGAGPRPEKSQPSAWSTYFATDDADLVTRRVEAAGGRVLTAPFDVLRQGRMAVFLDPAGAAFSVWQPMGRRGVELVDAPGALCWTELATPDTERAKEFYEAVFGWSDEDQPMGPITYTGWRLGERIIAGMMPMVGEEWAGEPAHWMVHFAVTDTDATTAHAQELGGDVAVPPTDVPPGRFAVLRDPQGASFTVFQAAPAPA